MSRVKKMSRNSAWAFIVSSILVWSSYTLGGQSLIYVPIGVGDITIFIPIYNNDMNENGILDADDPDLLALDVLPALCAAFIVGDYGTSIRFFTHKQRTRFESAIDILGPKAAAICSELENAKVIFEDDNIREYSVTRVVDGELRAYILTQTKEVDQVFRFSEF